MTQSLINIHVSPSRFVEFDGEIIEILDEEVLFTNGAHRRVRRWIKGNHPKLGVIIKGLTGFETVMEKDIIVPQVKFVVEA